MRQQATKLLQATLYGLATTLLLADADVIPRHEAASIAVVPHLDGLRESLLTANDDFGHAMIKLCAWSGRSELAKRLRWAGGSR